MVKPRLLSSKVNRWSPYFLGLVWVSSLFSVGCTPEKGAIFNPAPNTTQGDAVRDLRGELQKSLESAVSEIGSPGGILAVEDPQGTRWFFSTGVAEVNNLGTRLSEGWKGTAMTWDMQTRAGSITKSITSTLLLMLVDEGLIKLDDAVDSYLSGVPKGETISIRQLLNQTAGLYDYSDSNFVSAWPVPVFSPRQLLDYAIAHGPDGGSNFEPGTKWEYSNTNYVVAGMIAERVTGKSFHELVNTRILAPLLLNHSRIPAPEETTMAEAHVHGYVHGFLPAMPNLCIDTSVTSSSAAYSAGSLLSTAGDLLSWLRAVSQGRLLSSTSKKAMFTTVPTSAFGGEYGLGILVQKAADGSEIIGHQGTVPGYETSMYACKDWCVVSICNSNQAPSFNSLESKNVIVRKAWKAIFPNWPTESIR